MVFKLLLLQSIHAKPSEEVLLSRGIFYFPKEFIYFNLDTLYQHKDEQISFQYKPKNQSGTLFFNVLKPITIPEECHLEGKFNAVFKQSDGSCIPLIANDMKEKQFTLLFENTREVNGFVMANKDNTLVFIGKCRDYWRDYNFSAKGAKILFKNNELCGSKQILAEFFLVHKIAISIFLVLVGLTLFAMRPK